MIGQNSHFSLRKNSWGLGCHGLILGQALRDGWHIGEVAASHYNWLGSRSHVVWSEGGLWHLVPYLRSSLFLAHDIDIFLCFNAQDKCALTFGIPVIINSSLLTRLHILLIFLLVCEGLLVYDWIYIEEIEESLGNSTLHSIYPKVNRIFNQSWSMLLLAAQNLCSNLIDDTFLLMY